MANGYQTNISTKSYEGILRMYLWYYRGKFGGCRQIPTQKGVGIKTVLPRQGHLGKMCQYLAVVAACRRHVGDFLSQVGWRIPCRILGRGFESHMSTHSPLRTKYWVDTLKCLKIV
jgi:hypothetical protein